MLESVLKMVNLELRIIVVFEVKSNMHLLTFNVLL